MEENKDSNKRLQDAIAKASKANLGDVVVESLSGLIGQIVIPAFGKEAMDDHDVVHGKIIRNYEDSGGEITGIRYYKDIGLGFEIKENNAIISDNFKYYALKPAEKSD